jgi:hypothetical protein
MLVSRRDADTEWLDLDGSFPAAKGFLAHSCRVASQRWLSGRSCISSAHDPIAGRSLGLFASRVCPLRFGGRFSGLSRRFAHPLRHLRELLLTGFLVSYNVLGREDDGGWRSSQHGVV